MGLFFLRSDIPLYSCVGPKHSSPYWKVWSLAEKKTWTQRFRSGRRSRLWTRSVNGKGGQLRRLGRRATWWDGTAGARNGTSRCCHRSCGCRSRIGGVSISFPLFSIILFTRGQFWPSGIVVACVCLSVCVSVCVCVRQPRACPRHKSRRVQARTTKFGQKVQNNLVKVPIVLGGDWPWPSRSNLTWKAKFTPFWACPRHNS